jgi:hypothetical protein
MLHKVSTSPSLNGSVSYLASEPELDPSLSAGDMLSGPRDSRSDIAANPDQSKAEVLLSMTSSKQSNYMKSVTNRPNRV